VVRLIDLDAGIAPMIDENREATVGEFLGLFFEQLPPTIDAIPVEWLKQKTKHPDNYTRGSAKWILGCWKREQEKLDIELKEE